MSILKVGMYASQSRGANYLTFSSVAPFSIKFNQKSWDGVLEYSADTQNWYEWDSSEIYSVDNNLYLRGTGNTRITGMSATNGNASYAMQIDATDGVECSGNIMALLDHKYPDNAVMTSGAFSSLFLGQGRLITSPELPATTLADYCYSYMFFNCIRLTTSPELPAMKLTKHCYDAMLRSTGITVAPELPATVLEERCYKSMLRSTGITTAPALPATTLVTECYVEMLRDCTGIKISSTQTGIYQAPWRIPTAGTGTGGAELFWNRYMLIGTGGTFRDNPTINTTYYQAG